MRQPNVEIALLAVVTFQTLCQGFIPDVCGEVIGISHYSILCKTRSKKSFTRCILRYLPFFLILPPILIKIQLKIL